MALKHLHMIHIPCTICAFIRKNKIINLTHSIHIYNSNERMKSKCKYSELEQHLNSKCTA